MSFTERTKNIALAIVKIFETGKPLGNYSAVAVLDDGAGISYGTSQFTHKSGSLELVLRRYKILNGSLPDAIENVWPKIDTANAQNIASLSNNNSVKAALRELGSDPLMQQAQREIAWEKYLKPAIDACEGSNFTLPLSLAVIYDSINHGSYAKIRDQVKVQPLSNGSMKPEEFEKEWITEYVKRRDRWLESVPRLAKTGYRTDFFLAQIAKGNWDLELPMNVHGYRLTNASLAKPSAAAPTLPEKPEEPTVIPQVAAEAPPIIPLVPVPQPVIEVEQIAAAPEEQKEEKKEDQLVSIGNRASAAWAAGSAAVLGFGAWLVSTPFGIAALIIGAIALIAGIYLIVNAARNNAKEKRDHTAKLERERQEAELKAERERRAFELQKLTLESAMRPDLNAVKIAQPPATELANSEAQQ